MKTKRIAEISLELEKSNINPILVSELIDLKVESDMDKVMARFDQIDKQFNSIKWAIGIGFTFIGIVITIASIVGLK